MNTKTKVEKEGGGTRSQRVRGSDTRDAILATAIQHIGTLGFEGLRIRDIAKEVGINNATLHHHYPTKETLIAGVIERFVGDFEAAQPKHLTSDPDQRFEQYMARTREMMIANPIKFVIMNELLLRAARDPVVAKLMAPMQTRWREYLLYLLADAPLSDAERLELAERRRYELLGESLARGADRNVAPNS